MSKLCISCGVNKPHYGFNKRFAYYCEKCSKVGMVKKSEKECEIITCHEIASYGWTNSISCPEHANPMMVLIDHQPESKDL